MLTTTYNSRALERLGEALKVYQKASGRSLAFGMIKTGRELAFALLKETGKITPSEESLRALPESLGWNDRSLRKIAKRTDKSGWARHLIIKHGGVLGMIARRIKSRHFTASGWKPAVKGFSRPQTVTTTDRRLGAVYAQIQMDGNCHLLLINRTPVIETVTNQHDILHRAVAQVMEGFSPYIKDKLGEDAQKAFLNI